MSFQNDVQCLNELDWETYHKHIMINICQQKAVVLLYQLLVIINTIICVLSQTLFKQIFILIAVEKAMEQDKNISHSDQLALLCEEEIKRLEEKNTNIHYFALPEINIATNAAYAELRAEHERVRK